jgi:hypothetical protein
VRDEDRCPEGFDAVRGADVGAIHVSQVPADEWPFRSILPSRALEPGREVRIRSGTGRPLFPEGDVRCARVVEHNLRALPGIQGVSRGEHALVDRGDAAHEHVVAGTLTSST